MLETEALLMAVVALLLAPAVLDCAVRDVPVGEMGEALLPEAAYRM